MGIVMRILSTIVTLALLLGSGAVAPAAAVGEVTVSINAPTNVDPGDNFTATVDISQVQSFDAANYDVSFDPTVLEITIPIPSFNATQMYGSINGTTIPVDIVSLINAGSGPADPRVIRLVQNVSGLSGVNGTGYLAVLPFHVLGSPGQSSNINLSDGVLSSNLAGEIPAIWVGDLVNISGGGTISGHVFQSDNITPIAGAWIDVFDYASLSGWWVGYGGAQTGTDGSYQTSGLPTGVYGMRVRAAGYATEWYDNGYNDDEATSVSVTAPNDTPGINFSLEPGGSISGRAYQSDNITPIANMHIQAFNATTGQWRESTNTDSSGNYTISGLPAGSYKVRTYATYSGLNYVDEWYNNKYSQSEATPVSVTAPNDTPNINFSLEAGGSISGMVLDKATGLPLNDASSGSISLTTGWHKFVYRQQEKEGGQASRAAFKAPGDADWRWFSTSELEIRTAPDSGATSGILLINKKSTWTDHPRNHIELVALVDSDSTNESGWYGSSVVSIVNQNENIHGNDDYYTSYYEGYFYVGTPGVWHFSTDSDDASEIVIDEQVVAYWYNGHGSANRWEHKMYINLAQYGTNKKIASTFGNADGSYVFTNLPTGSYIVQVIAPGYATEWYNNKSSQSEATPVPVTAPNITSGIDFSLGPAKPDLTVTEKHEVWVTGATGSNYTVAFTIKNGGDAPAPSGHDVGLTVEGVTIEQKVVGVALGPGENYTASFTTIITLTGSRDDVTVYADVNGEISESNEGNNSRGNTIAWPPAPDLTISKSETWVIAGQSYQVYYTITNRGNAPAPAGHDVSLLVDGGTKEIKAVPGMLSPLQSYKDNFTTVINLTGGMDKVKVIADINGEVNESREDNNSSESTFAWPAAPDLIISDKFEKWVTGQSSNYTVNYQVRNMGNAPAPAGHDVKLMVDGNVVELKAVPVELTPGQSHKDVFNTVVTVSGSSDNITVYADSNTEVTESDETNNSRTNTWSSAAPALPDLIVAEKHEQWVVAGESYTVYFTIKNQGSGTAPAGYAVGLAVEGVAIEQKEMPVSLAPSANYTDNFTTTITLAGGYDMVRVEADVNGEVDESNEGNNRLINTIAWPPAPDLTVSKSETWVVQGASYGVNYTITNRGNAPAPAGHDVRLEVDGVAKETKAVPVTLSPLQSYSGNFTTTVTLTGGVDKVKVTADINVEVTESREDNNSYENTFAWPAAPDLIIGMKSEKWVDEQVGTEYTVSFSVRNIGNAKAPSGHDVKLMVDGTVIELKQVPVELSPYQSYSDTFDAVITISGSSDNITVWADANTEVAESDENNNGLMNTWKSAKTRWSVGLGITSSPNIGASDAIFGVAESATGGFDPAYDDPAPADPYGDGILAYFWYPSDPTTELRKLRTSYIAPANVLTWTLRVLYKKDGPTTGDVTITWNPTDIANVPSDFTSILLRNAGDNTTLADMKTQSSYTFPVTVPDGLPAAITTFVVKVSKVASFDLALKAGWNLVSLPVDPGVTDPNLILKDVGWYSIYTWDAAGKKYVKPGAEGMVVGKGYWVMVLTNVTQSISGAPVTQFAFNAPATGWYLIGSLYSPATFVASPPTNAYTKVYEWDAVGKKYTAPMTTIAPGTGNWFLALGPCSVTVSP